MAEERNEDALTLGFDITLEKGTESGGTSR